MTNKFSHWLAGAASAIILTALTAAGPANAQAAPGATFDEILAGAKREGKLTVWGSLPQKPETHAALIKAFNERFGLKTELEWIPNPPITSNSRAITESAGGRVSMDIIAGAAIEDTVTAANAGLIKKFPWSGVFGDQLPDIKDLEGRVIPEYRGVALPYIIIAYGIGWNPGFIDEAKVPKSYADLLDPKLKGKVGFNSFLAPIDVNSLVIGYDGAIDYAKALFANKPVFEKGTLAVGAAIIAGAVPFGIVNSVGAEASARAGEPLKFKLASDVVAVSPLYVYVPEGAPHPNTARLFSAWLAVEGSKVGDAFEPMARPGDPKAKLVRMIDEHVAATGAKVAQVGSVDDMKASAKVREALTNMISGK